MKYHLSIALCLQIIGCDARTPQPPTTATLEGHLNDGMASDRSNQDNAAEGRELSHSRRAASNDVETHEAENGPDLPLTGPAQQWKHSVLGTAGAVFQDPIHRSDLTPFSYGFVVEWEIRGRAPGRRDEVRVATSVQGSNEISLGLQQTAKSILVTARLLAPDLRVVTTAFKHVAGARASVRSKPRVHFSFSVPFQTPQLIMTLVNTRWEGLSEFAERASVEFNHAVQYAGQPTTPSIAAGGEATPATGSTETSRGVVVDITDRKIVVPYEAVGENHVVTVFLLTRDNLPVGRFELRTASWYGENHQVIDHVDPLNIAVSTLPHPARLLPSLSILPAAPISEGTAVPEEELPAFLQTVEPVAPISPAARSLAKYVSNRLEAGLPLSNSIDKRFQFEVAAFNGLGQQLYFRQWDKASAAWHEEEAGTAVMTIGDQLWLMILVKYLGQPIAVKRASVHVMGCRPQVTALQTPDAPAGPDISWVSIAVDHPFCAAPD